MGNAQLIPQNTEELRELINMPMFDNSPKPVHTNPIEDMSAFIAHVERVFQKTGQPAHAIIGDIVTQNSLGSGYFSHVFPCPWDSKKILKVGSGPSNSGRIYEDGWLKYAGMCMQERLKGSKNPLLMDIHRLYISPSNKWFIALIDRYDVTVQRSKGRQLNDAQLGAWHATRLVLGGRGGDNTRRKEYKYFTLNSEYLAHAAELQSHDDFEIDDLHDENMMFVGDRLVIIDPSSSDHGKRTREILTTLGVIPKPKEEESIPQICSVGKADHWKAPRKIVRYFDAANNMWKQRVVAEKIHIDMNQFGVVAGRPGIMAADFGVIEAQMMGHLIPDKMVLTEHARQWGKQHMIELGAFGQANRFIQDEIFLHNKLTPYVPEGIEPNRNWKKRCKGLKDINLKGVVKPCR